MVPESPKTTITDELVAAVGEVLTEHKVGAATCATILATVRDDAEDASTRASLRRFWRRFVLRNGLRPAAEAAGISRYRLLLAVADLGGNSGVWLALDLGMHRAELLDAVAAEKLARRDAERDASGAAKAGNPGAQT